MASKKEKFIEFVKVLMNEAQYDNWDDEVRKDWSDAIDYWNGLQMCGDVKPQFTENGKRVLEYMQENVDTYNNLFKAKNIGEGMEISSRTVSGAMRKLVNDGYVEKVGENPTVYSLTVAGKEVTFNEE